MALNKITYDNKVALNPQPSIANVNKCTDSDLNEIKSVVNSAIDQVDTNTENIENNSTYSTSEIQIGTWVDNKPLYRQVFELTSPSSASATASTIYTITTSIREIIRIYGCIHYQNITYRDINAYQTSNLFSFVDLIKIENNYEIRQCVTGDGYLSKPEKIIIEYTKTTD